MSSDATTGGADSGLLRAINGPGPALRAALLLVASVALLAFLFSRWEWSAIFWDATADRPAQGPFFAAIQILFLICCGWLAHRLPSLAPRRPVLLAILLTLPIAVMIGGLALDSFPNSGDEYAYLFQSWTYEAGRLWNPAPPLGQATAGSYTWVYASRWAGQYSPGWPLMMMPALRLGLPGWVANLPLLAASIAMLFGMVERRSGARIATLAVIFFAAAPFTLFQAASYFPHMAVATLVLLAYWSHDRLVTQDRKRWAALIGAAIGMLCLTRAFSAFLAAVPLGVALMLWRPFWARHVWPLAAGGLPFVAAYVCYQFALTGDWLTPTYYIGGRTKDHLYVGGIYLVKGIALTIGRFGELSLWTCPLVVPLWGVAMIRKARLAALEPADAVAVLGVALLAFYPFTGGNRYGARYYFDLWPLICFTVATSLPLISGRGGSMARAVVMLSGVYGLLVTPFLAVRYGQLVRERESFFEGARNLPGGAAVICIQAPAGGHLPLSVSDMTRNGIDAAGDRVFARCGAGMPGGGRAAYPGRTWWAYARAPGGGPARFAPIDPAGGRRPAI